ncbi:MAG: bifunctional serine/threonine-protein kinase/formylglycine-generating enzyme family protein [Calothrix sp. MO_167.B12]|nr:bifunctional serine/threonine-protein kinase/formylglycine-generating enzyme family protein [Calothrix sp. MO_167.B12]
MMLVGSILRNHYKIINKLGSGGFGDTYLAEDVDLPDKPQCVVKHLKPQSNSPAVLQLAQELFNREAEFLYRLGRLSNQIPKLLAHFEENGEFYLVQEFVNGHDLTKEIIPGQKLNEAQVVQLLQEILQVLAFVHQQNVIHRDIKPQNIMRRRDGKIILIDFGAVKEIQGMTIAQGQVTSTVSIGTAGYMPSEQALGKPRLCSDVYAVGMVAIQALTGILPHTLPQDANTGEVAWQDKANVSQELADILTNMVRYKFNERYRDADAALQALMPTVYQPPQPPPQQPQPSQTTQSTVLSPPTDWTRRRIIQTAGLMGGSFLVAVFGREIWQTVSSQLKPGLPLQNFSFQTVTVDANGNITNRPKHSAKYFTEDLGNGVTLDMVQIPGGTFTMGSPAEEKLRDNDESPQHQVTVQPFYMGRYEVTQAQYQAIMGNNPSNFKGQKRPVETVSWNDAVEFCKKLSQKTGRTYRLPSEAEWEYACRAGTTTPFYFGETITTSLVNYNGNYPYGSAPKGEYRKQTTDVGTFPPNTFGLYDMHGNVWEWCQDTWHSNYNGAPTDGSAWIDNKNRSRLLRGGSWVANSWVCRSAGRDSYNPGAVGNPVGFRVCAVVV